MDLKTDLTSHNYTAANRKSISYIVIHYTANNGDTAAGNANYFRTSYRGASAHYFVDETGVVQVVRDRDIAWHCGDTQKYIRAGGAGFKGKCRNANSIGVEMCSDVINGVFVITEDTQRNAAELVRMLTEKYQVPLARVIRHFDVTGKICPKPFVDDPERWYLFRERLKGEEEMKRYNSVSELPKALQKEAQELVDSGALAGGSAGLDVTEDMIRVMIVNKRYVDLVGKGKN